MSLPYSIAFIATYQYFNITYEHKTGFGDTKFFKNKP